ncbi:hypothetical protein D3C72_2034310 [compost metagenome]
MPANVRPNSTALPSPASSPSSSSGSTKETACSAKASISARISPSRAASRSQPKVDGTAASPTSTHAALPWPANAAVCSRMATMKVALTTKPNPAQK